VKDCLFLKQKEDLSKIKDATGLPLILNKNVIGYLAVSGLREEEKDKFHILGQQFLLGLERALLYKKVQELSITDSLTQIYSRRYFLEKLEEEISRAKKFQLSFAFLMVDIDHFKKINDNYGHLVGDVILKEVAKAIKENVRQIDFMGRYGGEELSIILTETNKQDAGLITERIRQAVESRQIKAYDETLNTTVSIGVSVYPADATNSMALIDKADQALYRAKLSGRNKVCFSS
jgi:diguanylate cyclase (GGDEF)-like protein